MHLLSQLGCSCRPRSKTTWFSSHSRPLAATSDQGFSSSVRTMQARAEKVPFQNTLPLQIMHFAAHMLVWYCMVCCACWALLKWAERLELCLGLGSGGREGASRCKAWACEDRPRHIHRRRHTHKYQEKYPIYADAGHGIKDYACSWFCKLTSYR